MNRPTDDLDDLQLPQRPRRADPRVEMRSESRASSREDLRDDMAGEEREFTLSTGTVLALFFGLALVCAVFFGFGYSMGRKSAAATAIPVADAAGNDSTTGSSADIAAKPSAGAPAIQAIPSYQASQKSSDTVSRSTASPVAKAPASANSTSVTVPMDSTAAPVKPRKPAIADPDGQVVGDNGKPTPSRPASATTGTPAQTAIAAPATVAGGTNYVQIAAVSHKEDADVLLGALRRRGYSVFTRSSDTDKLIHVQVGPFATKKDAEAMRLKLQGDGYNAILK